MKKWFNFGKKKPAPAKKKKGYLLSTHNDFDIDDLLSPADRMRNAVARSIQIPINQFVTMDRTGGRGEGRSFAMDSSIETVKYLNNSTSVLPLQQIEWYGGQGFIGWQLCAILAQQWLIDKACTMPGEDAVRNGWELSVKDGTGIDAAALDEYREWEKKFDVQKHCIEYIRNARIFGIRHALFLVTSDDPDYYEKPFNPDGVKPGSYRGISQIDPYWMTPVLNLQAAADPADPHFYDPTWWVIGGKRVHRTHFVILRNGGEVPDILKPTYFYGGIPTTQKIYERVYAAERTANEAPLLAMSKRMTVLKLDTTQAMADNIGFPQKMEFFAQNMNNFGVKTIGLTEEINQFDTNLTNLDETIMTQYQLVAAASGVPATKLLGTTPKGFNSTGEYEEKSYHEHLVSIQGNSLTALIDRHTLLVTRSFVAPKLNVKPFNVTIKWNPVDIPDAKEQAEINEIESRTIGNHVNAGVLDSLDGREALINNKNSGFSGIELMVPGGPGDRDAIDDEENPGDLGGNDESDDSAMDELNFDPVAGMYGEARIITHQRHLDRRIVREKSKQRDYLVNVTPEFMDEGKKYRMVIDGHHSLAAALQDGVAPVFVEQVPRDVVFNPITGKATDRKDA